MRSFKVIPGSTVMLMAGLSKLMTWSMPLMSSTSPPSGTVAPTRLVPPERTTTGTLCLKASLTAAITSSRPAAFR